MSFARRIGLHEEVLHIDVQDGTPADVEHVTLASAVAHGAMTVEDANKIGAKLVHAAKFAWRRG